jgi:hypothetical protein
MVINEVIEEYEINTLIEIGRCFEKEFYMEAVQGLENLSNVKVPDPNSKWTQFKNWVSRAINMIVAKIRSKTFKKALEKYGETDINRINLKMPKYQKYLFNRLMGSRRIGSAYKDTIPKYVKGQLKVSYKQTIARYQKEINRFKHDKDTELISIRADYSNQLIEWIKAYGQEMVNELPDANKHLKELSNTLTEEDRKSDKFKEYIQMITLRIQLDLNIVREMTIFLDSINKITNSGNKQIKPPKSFNKKSEEQETSEDDHGPLYVHPKESSDESTESSDGETSESSDNRTKSSNSNNWTAISVDDTVMGLCKKFVFNKYPGCSEIKIKEIANGNYSVEYDDGNRNHHHEFKLEKFMKVPGIGGILKKAITPNALDKAKHGGIVIKKR